MTSELFTTFDIKINLRTFKNFCFDLTKKIRNEFIDLSVFLETFDFGIHFKKENFFSPSVFLSPLFKAYKKGVKFSFTQQKIFWVLVFSICIWYLDYPMDRSYYSYFVKKLNFK